jgi:outer membrane protein OmpA-like peptidoglycan-associated protein
MKPDNQRRKGKARSAEAPQGATRVLDSDPLSELREALRLRDPDAFAACFSADGWMRVPRPEGDIAFRSPQEIARAGHELRDTLADLTWTPSQRFLSAGQVVEEAVVRARTVDDSGPAGGQIQVSMRVVTALDPAGGIGSLTLWIDWAALRDPLGVDSARGAASALVAQVRARDARGLQVIEGASEPEPSAVLVDVPTRPERSARPPAVVLWWRQHRRTVAGTVMAVLAVAVLGWVGQSVLKPSANRPPAAIGPTASATASPGSSGSATGAPTPTAKTTVLPSITRAKPSTKPTVQAGKQVTLRSDVLFETGSTKLTTSAWSTLRELAAGVQTNHLTGTIQINGYTDNVGGTELNEQLSDDRATAVAEALQSYLVGSPVILMPQAFGESDPTASNATAKGRAANRRVTVVLPTPA